MKNLKGILVVASISFLNLSPAYAEITNAEIELMGGMRHEAETCSEFFQEKPEVREAVINSVDAIETWKSRADNEEVALFIKSFDEIKAENKAANPMKCGFIGLYFMGFSSALSTMK